MKTRLVALALLFAAAPAMAEELPALFAKRAYVWRETEADQRFSRSGIAQGLENAPKDKATARVVASLLAAYAEATPYFQKKDEQFFLFSVFINPITTSDFPAGEYLRHMVRRTMLDGHAPEAWLKTAKQLKKTVNAPIDLERLRYAVDGVQLVDNATFGLAVLIARFQRQVELASTAGLSTAMEDFGKNFRDRDVAWPGMQLDDVVTTPTKGRKGAEPEYVASLRVPGSGYRDPLTLPPEFLKLFPDPERANRPPSVYLKATLAPKQYFDPKKATKMARYVLRGRLTGLSSKPDEYGMNEYFVTLEDAMLFEDRDLSGYGGFASRADVLGCKECVNQLQ